MEELARGGRHGVALVEAALMVETGYYRQFDLLVVVLAPPEIQIQRVMSRDGLTREQVEARIAAQMPPEEKARIADFVVHNGGSLEETRGQVLRVSERLREAAKGKDAAEGHFD